MRVVLIALVLVGCDPAPERSVLPRELQPVAPLGPEHDFWTPQPHRDRPTAIVEASGRLFVALAGTETRPGHEVAVLDGETLALLDRIDVGLSPVGLAVHPRGRFVAVASRFASYVSIIDAERSRVVLEVPTPFYTEAIAFSPDGSRAVAANRWKDSILRWNVRVEGGDIDVERVDRLDDAHDRVGIPVPANPRRVRYVDEHRVVVTSETALTVSLVDTERGEIVESSFINAPVTDALVVGEHVIVLHTGSGAGHPPDEGFDGDRDGSPGDGTANVTFQDVQNEIDVLDASDLSRLQRYTSDTICCRDYRDVDPDDPTRGTRLRPVDAWPPERVAFLPPRETWIVEGAMPERVVSFRREDGGDAIAVVFGGSSQVQTFDLTSSGTLVPRTLHETGHGAIDALWQERDRRLLVVNRLGESLTVHHLDEPEAPVEEVVVGDVSDGTFPATDAELGEAFNTMTALFSVDGDQTCVHCHRDGSPIAKPVSMPLLESPEWGVRNVMAYRGANDTRPWFVEAAMDEDNFFPVINELARRENFCCEQSDVLVWSSYPSHESCFAEPETPGCNHVLDCENDPPPECDARGYGGEALTRERHFRDAAQRIFGRDESFGDALYGERLGPDGEIIRVPIRLGFDGITRALGIFLLTDSRLLPNPNGATLNSRAIVGRALFSSPRTGCATCHPIEGGGAVPATFAYVVSPVAGPAGLDADRVNPAFLGTFPEARQTSAGLRVGVPSLRGLWDRDVFLHHGLATTLREAIANPGHPALRPGETGFNERFGQPDSHGSTSTLSIDELDALVSFLESM